MTKHSELEIREACHIMAEQIMRIPSKRNSMKWLKEQILEILLKEDNIRELAADYSGEYEYADVANPYLVEVLKAYDEE